MKIIKRNGAEVIFDRDKIVMAVTKANDAVEDKYRMTPLQIQRITENVQISCEQMGRSPSVEEIQDLVEKSIMAHGAFEVAKAPWAMMDFSTRSWISSTEGLRPICSQEI